MSQIEFDVPYVEPRNRLTVAFRLILAIPHLILLGLWQQVAEVAAVIHWFVIVFTGKRNDSLWQFNDSYVGYMARVNAYTGILYDEYPQFFTDASGVPVHYAHAPQPEPANRLTVGLRFIWAIPALFIAAGLSIAGIVIGIIAWFAIVITGKMPRGNFEFLVKVQRYVVQTNAYVLLQTDTYPAWG